MFSFRLYRFVLNAQSNKVENLQSVYGYDRKTEVETNQALEINVCQDGKRL